MSAPDVKGWCPGALRPMMSGDGLVVRIRPPLGRLSQVQAKGVATLSRSFGGGVIDISNRANVQLRGVDTQSYAPLIAGLRDLDLIDDDVLTESRRNIIVSPFVEDGFASALAALLARTDAPDVSAKFGYAIDTGKRPVLQAAPADVRLERDVDGGLLVCAADHPCGLPVSADVALAKMLDLARWSIGRGARMAQISELPEGFDVARQIVAGVPLPSVSGAGALVAAAFGQFSAEAFAGMASLGALRMTPWRMVLIENYMQMPDLAGLIVSGADAMLRVVACAGAPACAQGLAGTRALAGDLAKHVPQHKTLHVSGCTKGCARPAPSDITLTATSAGFDLIYSGKADAVPTLFGLSAADIPDLLEKAP